jgi:hypothetical protein
MLGNSACFQVFHRVDESRVQLRGREGLELDEGVLPVRVEMFQSIGSVWSMLSLTPYGAQSDDEDAPEGWPQAPFSFWFRRHDELNDLPPSAST